MWKKYVKNKENAIMEDAIKKGHEFRCMFLK